ncbi:MAG: ATP-dependent zinc protease [Congregibacter sp.]
MAPTNYAVLAALCLLLAGCQSTPTTVETDPTDKQCPVIEAVECPICEIATCPTPEIVETPALECPAISASECTGSETASRFPIIGETEWAVVEPGDLVLEARIDTGAETSSIHAENIQLIEKDGKRWVRFTMLDPETDQDIQVERRLHRRILVKQKASDNTDRRYVVRMWVTIGDTRTWLDVSLSDRDDFEFPLLIGRNMLIDAFVVDVSKHHTLPKPSLEEDES